MKYFSVKITDRALADMNAIYDYIAEKLQARETAMRQYSRIAEAVKSLQSLPNRCQLLDIRSDWSKTGSCADC